MLARLILFLCIFLCAATAQNILSVINADPRITQFAKSVAASPNLAQYFKSQTLTVLIPSDEAMNATTLGNVDRDRLWKSHMFQSINNNQSPVVGTTTNWNSYKPVEARGGVMFYYKQSVEDFNRLFLSVTGGVFQCNEALVTVPNIVNGTQVYHIIDRVLTNNQFVNFLSYLKSNATLSQSLQFWEQLRLAENTGSVPAGYFYRATFTAFDEKFPGTVLVPTNAAWGLLNQVELDNLKNNISALLTVMGRFYIPDNLYFVRGQDIQFKAGFNEQPRLNENNLFPGFITKDLQVSVQDFTAKIIQPNMPISFGVVHLIDNPLVKKMTVDEYLTNNNRAFMKQITAFNMSQYLTGAYAIMAPDDGTVSRVTNQTALQQNMLNSFIPSTPPFGPNTGAVKTVGNLTIRMRSADGNNYIDVLKSPTDNTWVRSVPVGAVNQLVGSLKVTQINGLITDEPMSCDSMLTVLNASIYQSLVASNSITLFLGSPYTMMVPINEALSNYIAQQNTTPTTSPTMKYVLQRMIIPARLPLATRSAGTFNAATMNYAAMAEKITMTISETNDTQRCTISMYGVQQSFNYSAGGFYCYSNPPNTENRPNDPSRHNLIYPVRFVLATPPGTNVNICVNPPCLACHSVVNGFLLVVASVIAALWNSYKGHL